MQKQNLVVATVLGIALASFGFADPISPGTTINTTLPVIGPNAHYAPVPSGFGVAGHGGEFLLSFNGGSILSFCLELNRRSTPSPQTAAGADKTLQAGIGIPWIP